MNICKKAAWFCTWFIIINCIELNIHQYSTDEGANVPECERNALYDLYTFTNGNNWRWNRYGPGNPWNFTVPNPNPCSESWQGITCMPDPFNVSSNVIQSIKLNDHNLNGIIPESLGNLTYLQIFDVQNNLVRNPLPTTIGTLSHLTTLILSTNQFSGPIPVPFGSLHSLESLSLESTNFNGTIPLNLCQLTKLKKLQLSDNKLTGSIPWCIGNLTQLEILDVGMNNLNGTLPTSMSQFENIQTLLVTRNYFTGTIPEFIGELVTLQTLSIDTNIFTGSISSSLGALRLLDVLELSDNMLNGTIPLSICSLQNVTLLNFGNNRLNGSIPYCIGNMTELTHIYMEWNFISGSIPASLYTLPKLYSFLVYRCNMTGSISPMIGNLTTLLTWFTYENLLTGSIPNTIGQITQLEYFNSYDNYHTGPLPSSLSNCSILQSLQLYNNMLTSTIPDTYGHFINIHFFELYNNAITGSLAPNFGSHFRYINEFSMYNNQLTGTLPSAFLTSHTLITCSMYNNYMTGSIPNENYGYSYPLQFLLLYSNLFSGSLPSTLGNLTMLIQFQVSNNLLTGTLPTALSVWSFLETFFINSNQFIGNLDNVFDNTTQIRLINVDISDNRFTGIIPKDLFHIPAFQSFAAVSNCFDTADLPHEICTAYNLQTLALDGLMTGSSCQHTHRFFPSYTHVKSYWLDRNVDGTIPQCLFSLPKLSILHLSGNEFTSSIPSDLNVSHALSDLSLSNNNLIGAVPSVIQYKQWSNLDLSYNKLGGTLSTSFPVYDNNATLSLQVNRLSGEVPSSLKNTEHISILDGNLFGCDANRNSLPVNDPNANDYECGSNTFNYSMFVWLSFLVLFVIGAVIIWLLSPHQSGTMDKPTSSISSLADDDCMNDIYTAVDQRSSIQSQRIAIQKANVFHKLLRYIAVFEWSDSQRSTSMRESILFTRESLGTVIISRANIRRPSQSTMITPRRIALLGEFLTQYRHICVLITLFALCVMLPVNVTLTSFYNSYTHEYAWILSSAYLGGVAPSVILLFVCVFLVIFVVVIWSRKKRHERQNDVSPSVSPTTRNTHDNSWNFQQMLTLTLLILFNICLMTGVNVAYVYIHDSYGSNIVQIAQIAVAIFKVTWNNFAVRGILKLNKQFIHQNLQASDTLCESDAVAIDTHVGVAILIMLFNNLAAPFIATALVSSNCYYDVITTPKSVVVSYLYTSCALYAYKYPVGNVCIEYVYGADPRTTSYIPPFTYSYQCSSAFITTYASVYVFMFLLIATVLPLTQCLIMYVHSRSTQGSALHRRMTAMLPNILKPLDSVSLAIIENSWERTAMFSVFDIAFSNRLFDCDVFVVQLVNFLTILVTFGVVFPPIAVVALVAVFSITYITQMYIGRFVCMAMQNTGVDAVWNAALKNLEHDCTGVRVMFVKSLWMVAPFVLVFYSYLLFDILGDEVGWRRAVWMPVVVICIPFCMWLSMKLRRCANISSSNDHIKAVDLDLAGENEFRESLLN